LNEFWMRVRTVVVVVLPELLLMTLEMLTRVQFPAWVWAVTGMISPRPSRLPLMFCTMNGPDCDMVHVLLTCAGAAASADASGVRASIPLATTPTTIPALFSTVSPDRILGTVPARSVPGYGAPVRIGWIAPMAKGTSCSAGHKSIRPDRVPYPGMW
jgi:hypothetical protein